jgi:hypothetical protein
MKTAAIRVLEQMGVAHSVHRIPSSCQSADEAAEALISLQRDKRLTIEETNPYSSLASYARSPYSFWFWGAIAVVGISLVLISATSGVALYLRYVFGAALVLFIPGYSLIEALYPKRDLEELTRFALSVGLSLALVPLAGLVLNYTPFGIRLLPVALSIAGLSGIFLVAALVRKYAYYKLAKGMP